MTRTVRGVLGSINPTSVGGIGAFLLVMTAAPLLSRKARATPAHGMLFALAIAVIVLAHSRTAIFGATAALIVLLAHSRRLGLAFAIGGAGAVIMLLTSAGELVESYLYRGQSQELFLSMSGRTYYWGEIFDKFLESPIYGHGFYSMRTIFLTSSADNTYLQILLDFGLVGLIVILVPVLYLITTLYRTRPRGARSLGDDVAWQQLAGLSIVMILRSAVGTSFQILHHGLPLFLIMLLGTAAWRRIYFARQRVPDRRVQGAGLPVSESTSP